MPRPFKKHVWKFILSLLLFMLVTSAITAPMLRFVFKPGIMWTYDGDLHQFRMAAFHNALKEGNIPPRWSSQLAYGWGSPVLHYNWSLPYWMAEPFLFLHWTTTQAQKAVVGMAIPLSFMTMALLLGVWFGFWPAIGGATLYIWALFRLYLLFTGGSSGMEVSFIFWPLLFLAVTLAMKGHTSRTFIIGSLVTALTMLAHQVMFLMIQPLLWFYVILVHQRYPKKRIVPVFIGSFITGLALSAYFWLPALTETGFIRIHELGEEYRRNFLDPIVLLLQPGIFQLTGDDWWRHIYATGWVLLAIASFSLCCVLRSILKSPKTISERTQKNGLFVGFFFLSLFLMTPYSQFIWDYLPLLSSFIYPIRFQALAVFTASILAADMLSQVHHGKIVFSIVLIVVTILLNFKAIPIQGKWIDWPDSYYFYGDSTGDMRGEFLPRQTDADHFFGGDRWERKAIARITFGTGTIDSLQKYSSSLSFRVLATTEVTVVINQLYFPGWKVMANDHEITVTPAPSGEMVIRVLPGSSNVRAVFTDTPVRTVGNWITILSGLGMIFWITISLVKRHFVLHPPVG